MALDENSNIAPGTSLPTEEEMLDYISKVDDYRSGIAPEDTTGLAKIADAEEKAGQLYRAKADRAEWASLFEQLGRSLTRYGAATQGLKAGVDVSSNLKLDEPTDYDKRTSGYLEEYKTELGLQGRLRDALGKKQELEQKRLDAQAGRTQKELDRTAADARVSKQLAGNIAVAKIGVEGKKEVQEMKSEEGKIIPKTTTPDGREILLKKGKQYVFEKGELVPYTGETVPVAIAIQRMKYGAVAANASETQKAFDSLSLEGKTAVKEMQKQFAQETSEVRKAYSTIGDLVETAKLARTNSTALSQLGIKMAKALGEKGALSQADVTRYIERQGLLNIITDMREKWGSGKISAGALEEVLQTIESMKAEFPKGLSILALEKANTVTSKYGGSPALLVPSIYGGIDTTAPVIASPTAATVTALQAPTEERVRALMDKKKLTKEQAVEALRRYDASKSTGAK